jgi:hypothetical protein
MANSQFILNSSEELAGGRPDPRRADTLTGVTRPERHPGSGGWDPEQRDRRRDSETKAPPLPTGTRAPILGTTESRTAGGFPSRT